MGNSHIVFWPYPNNYPLLYAAEQRELCTDYFISHGFPITLQRAQRILADKTRHIQPAIHGDHDWQHRIPHQHRLPMTKLGNVARHALQCVNGMIRPLYLAH